MNCDHDWQPVERMRAVYRCSRCLVMGYKQAPRTGFGVAEIVPYACSRCGEPAVRYYRHRINGKRIFPTCNAHKEG